MLPQLIFVRKQIHMRPVFARRKTTCDWCKEDILPGTRRYDDVIKTPKFYRRIHYHALVTSDEGEIIQQDCYAIKTSSWFEKHKDDVVVTSNNGGGHPPSDLSTEQRTERDKILVRLANLTRYYRDRLQLQTSVEDLTSNELRQFNNFALRFKECKELLEPLGGLPPRYREMGIGSAVEEEIESQVESVVVMNT